MVDDKEACPDCQCTYPGKTHAWFAPLHPLPLRGMCVTAQGKLKIMQYTHLLRCAVHHSSDDPGMVYRGVWYEPKPAEADVARLEALVAAGRPTNTK